MNSPFDANKQKKPFSWWQMLLFILLFIGFLIFLFPQKLFMNTLLKTDKPSAVSISYLQNAVKNNPTDADLRVSLAQQQFQLGQVEEAKKTITPYINDRPNSNFEWRILWLYYKILTVEAFQLKEHNPQRKEKEALLRSLQNVLIHSPLLTSKELLELADSALAFDRPDLADLIYQKINLQGENQSVAFYAKAGKVALYVKNYQGSANYFLMAMKKSTSLDKKRLYYTKALDSLRAGGTESKALEFAQKNIDGLEKDKNTLMYLAKLALGAGQQKVAEQYINQLLQLKYRGTAE
ncbi:hypothetical protein Lsan_0510 [Legionella santicrucis]|uniref:Tetratricopeptide repeat protein n=1 Tax=Legionella santicrucis TaxID=45074 RepID=A0A0W0ZBJ6_9GAMM|nr:tetratricopeptide repeat protein [Legionella santicrucis]KTD66565.1 hypothetical protein Lsan_0510 [Legionella santicrucis]